MKYLIHIIYITLITFFAFYGHKQKGYADNYRELAEIAKLEAEMQKVEAERLAEVADGRAAEAIIQKNLAMQATEKAEVLKKELEKCKSKK